MSSLNNRRGSAVRTLYSYPQVLGSNPANDVGRNRKYILLKLFLCLIETAPQDRGSFATPNLELIVWKVIRFGVKNIVTEVKAKHGDLINPKHSFQFISMYVFYNFFYKETCLLYFSAQTFPKTTSFIVEATQQNVHIFSDPTLLQFVCKLYQLVAC